MQWNFINFLKNLKKTCFNRKNDITEQTNCGFEHNNFHKRVWSDGERKGKQDSSQKEKQQQIRCSAAVYCSIWHCFDRYGLDWLLRFMCLDHLTDYPSHKEYIG